MKILQFTFIIVNNNRKAYTNQGTKYTIALFASSYSKLCPNIFPHKRQ